MKTEKIEEKRRRGRPSKQITIYNEKKVNKQTKKEIVKEEVMEVVLDEIQEIEEIQESVLVEEQEVVSDVITENVPKENISLGNIKTFDLPKDKYYDETTIKRQIVLHHTGTAPGVKSDINYYLRSNDKTSTHYLIERNGDIINVIDPDKWCHHLKIKNLEFKEYELQNLNTLLNKSSISIDLDSWGELEKVNDNRYKNNGGIPITILKDDVSYYEKGFKGSYYYQKYTNQQLESLKKLLIYLSNKYNIPLTYKGDEIFNKNKNALTGEEGVWTHVSYRTDVNNCHPDEKLVELLKSFK